jgi:transcription elongation factor Elf1
MKCPKCGLIKLESFVLNYPQGTVVIVACKSCGFSGRATPSSINQAINEKVAFIEQVKESMMNEQVKTEKPIEKPHEPSLILSMDKKTYTVTLAEFEKKGITVRPESEQNPECNLKKGHVCGFHTDTGLGLCLKPIVEDHKLKGFTVRTCSKFKKKMEKMKVEG